MAIIGFIVLLVIGFLLLIWSVMAGLASASFSGKVDPVCYIVAAVGGLLLYGAYVNAPLSVVFH